MYYTTIGIFGNKDFMKKLGKQGTVNDIVIYNHADSEGILICVSPDLSGEKIQPLLQTINIIDAPVIVSDALTKELAEQIIALDAFGFEKGFIISSSDDLKKIIRGTSVENFEWVKDETELREKIKHIQTHPLTDDIWIPIDNYFNVKSVGTVILSVIKGGTIKKYDKLTVQPINKEVIIKGLQSQDKNIEQASQGMRAGINLKGVNADEIRRGYVLCSSAMVSKDIIIKFTKNMYSKEPLKKDLQIFLSVGLQVIPGRIKSIEDLTVSIALEHPVAYISGQKCLLATTSHAMPRTLGTGIIKRCLGTTSQ